MSDNTSIEWTDATWNPIRGCSRVSQGCVHCYAEGQAARFKGPGQAYEGLINSHGKWNGNIRFVEHALDQPQRWRKPRRIFVNSMSDLFHENVTDEQIDKIFHVMESKRGDRHTYQILTKRPQRMLEYMLRYGERMMGPPPNVWLGVSVEDQAAADERIPLLLQTPAEVRFLSCEPLLGSIELTNINLHNGFTGQHNQESATSQDYLGHLHWVIVGGESGRSARPMHPNWARSLRDQCAVADVPFFFKQWGEWCPYRAELGTDVSCIQEDLGTDTLVAFAKVGKKRSGRLLDGRLHDEFPQENAR